MMKQRRRSCELCGGEASIYCEADAAFLCFRCDRRVHSANFLVARHLRRLTCSACLSGDDPALVFTGPGSGPIRPLCRLCGPDPSPSASSCVSSADSDSPPARSAAMRVFERWGKAMGVRRGRRCADVAVRAMGACRGQMAVLPLRAAMAAAMWFAARSSGRRTCEGTLRRLERCSGVPAKVVLSYEARIARALERWRRPREAATVEEGWGECS